MTHDPELSALLEERARHLARPLVMPRRIADVAALLAFDVGRERFLLQAIAIGEILRALRPSRLPGMPPWVEGVVGSRGRAIPLVRLDRMVAGHSAAGEEETSAVAGIVLADTALALRADRLLGVRPRPEQPPRPLPSGSSTELQAIAIGTFGTRIVLDTERLVRAITDRVRGPDATHPPVQQGDVSHHATQR